MAAGYSGRPLVDKLGIKPGMRIRIVNAPDGYADLLGPLPAGVVGPGDDDAVYDFIQIFVRERAVLESALGEMRGQIVPNGMIWVSWPKKASGVPSDVSEDVVREIALAQRLVDVKVVAVDQIWSGLKLVIRLADRP